MVRIVTDALKHVYFGLRSPNASPNSVLEPVSNPTSNKSEAAMCVRGRRGPEPRHSCKLTSLPTLHVILRDCQCMDQWQRRTPVTCVVPCYRVAQQDATRPRVRSTVGQPAGCCEQKGEFALVVHYTPNEQMNVDPDLIRSRIAPVEHGS